jgi:hypothetical protein
MLSKIRLALALLGLMAVVACGGTVGSERGTAGAGPGAQGGAPGSAGAPMPSAGSGNSGNVGSNPGGAPSAGGGGGEAGEGGSTGTCLVDGVEHAIGERFACDCNTCWCETDGTISTTLIACNVNRCEYAGQSYAVGEAFPSQDGCNECYCEQFGQVSCTAAFCGCHPDKEWFREYVGLDARTCSLIDYVCPANTVTFHTPCGCGCEQDSACPASIDCEPGADNGCEILKAHCPYSQVAY